MFFFFGESVKDETGNHNQEADKKGQVIGFGRVRVVEPRKGFNNPSHEGHADSTSSHRKKVDPRHRCARNGNWKEAF